LSDLFHPALKRNTPHHDDSPSERRTSIAPDPDLDAHRKLSRISMIDPNDVLVGPEASGREVLDCVVVGGGPAGLTAGLYLRRFHRHVRVIDAGAGRARRISRSHNVAGFPDGVAGVQLLDRMRRHLQLVGGHVILGTVGHIERRADGLFAIGLAHELLWARNVLLCTGVKDRLPVLPGVDAVEAADLLRYCPVCDGYEHTGKRIGVIGNSNHGVKEAAFLKNFSGDVWFIEVDGCTEELDHDLRAAGVRQLPGVARHLAVDHDHHAFVTMDDGEAHRFDVLYAGLGVDPRTQLAVTLGAALDEVGSVVTDAHGRTSISNLYAAGDVANGLDQIGVAVGHAAIAATAIHNSL
jgi:thioredoxin reductase (NADPH)